MAYPFVPARHFAANAIVSVRAFIWHMAEGYSTASYFQHTDRSVSSHYVVERTGRIVQCVRDRDAAFTQYVSIDDDDRDASDCSGLYDPAAARRLLGAAGWADINRFVISTEVEGFRAEGPNALQIDAIGRLGTDLRRRYPDARGNLGHRDVQDYKSCPGCKFPWSVIGGHGDFDWAGGSTDMTIQAAPGLESDYVLEVPKGTPFYADAGLVERYGLTFAAATAPYIGPGVDGPSRAVVLRTGQPYQNKEPRPSVVYVHENVGTPKRREDAPRILAPGTYEVR